jgi:hypothetical protein
MTFSALWTTVPGGIDPTNPPRIRLSLIASPRVEGPVADLGASDLADWPARVRSLGPLALQIQGQPSVLPATVTSAPPNTQTWQRLLPASTTVSRPVNARRVLTTPDETYVQAAASLETIFTAPGGGPVTEQASGDVTDQPPGPAARAITALHGLTVDGGRGDARLAAALPASARARGPVALHALGGTELAATVSALRTQGHEDLAVALPIAAHVAALRGPSAPPGGPVTEASGGPAPLDGINRLPQSDVHQIVGLLLDHPVLAVAVGLRVDLVVTIPATGLDGVRLVRVVRADGTPLGNPPPTGPDHTAMIARPQPWSRVRLDRTAGVFTMADGGEIRGGLLDLGVADPARPYLLSTTDVTGLSHHLAAITPPGPGQQLRLPVRHNVGLTLAQGNRPTGVVESAMNNAVALAAGAGSVDGAPVLTAADVTTGYRIDVSSNGGPFRSLVKRGTRYTVGTGPAATVLTAPVVTVAGSDEGVVQRAVAVQQKDPDGQHRLRVGEEIGQWRGWSMAAPRPGRTVAGEPGNPNTTEPIGPQPIPGIPLTAEVTAEPGSLTPLRYGRRYRLRGRTVFLGGLSAAATLTDTSQVTPEQAYLRTGAVSSPTLVHRVRNTEGESLTRLVIRSTGDGTAIGGAAERHVAPPKTSVELAEWHGAFDAAFGPDSPARAAARATLLTVAKREAGSFLEPGPGVAAVTNNPTHIPPVTLPPPRGEALPNGVYVVHDTATPRLPYLADVVVGGAAVSGLTPAPVLLPYAGTWPEISPGRVVVRHTSGGAVTATVKTDNGRPVLFVDLPPGTERTVRLSSTIRPERLAEFDLGANPDLQLPTTGQHPLLTPAVELTLVHAVRKPVTAPSFATAPTHTAETGKTGVPISSTVTAHRDSTARLDLIGTWTETVDTGTGPVRPTTRTVVAGSVDVERGTGAVPLAAVHQLGDTRAVTVAYSAVASTRFAEYFPGRAAGAEGQRPGPAATLTIPNRAFPPEPDVIGVVPTFATTRTVSATGVVTSTRTGTGVRVLLRRRWNVTGDGEQLGVVVFPDAATGAAALTDSDGRLDLVARWGSDPLEETIPRPVAHLTPGRFARRDLVTTKPVPLRDAPADGRALTVVGHRVEFDPARDLWFADVDILIPETPWPFVRLGLLRYQPTSLPGRSVSKVVKTDFCQLPPTRKAVFTRSGAFGIKVVISGAATRNSTFTLRQERRVHAPASSGIDIFSDSGVAAGTAGWVLTDVTAQENGLNVLSALLLTWTGTSPPPNDVAADLRNGRVVVEEIQNGLAVSGPGADSRVVYTDTVDRAALGIG